MSDDKRIKKKGMADLSVSSNQIKAWLKNLETTLGKSISVSIKTGRLYLLMDCSVSMASHEKMAQAKNGAKSFTKDAIEKGYAVGLIAFGSFASHVSDPSTQTQHIEGDIDSIIVGGSTNMAAAIQMATVCLGKTGRLRVMVIVTDGMPDDQRAALKAAEIAKAAGIEIITISTDDADREFLARLASRSELSRNVGREQLARAIADSARLLPKP